MQISVSLQFPVAPIQGHITLLLKVALGAKATDWILRGMSYRCGESVHSQAAGPADGAKDLED